MKIKLNPFHGMKPFEIETVGAIIGAILAIWLFSGCFVTVAPKPVVSHYASFDENVANSGIISSDANGFVVTQHFITRHGISNYAAEGKYFRITAETMDAALQVDAAKRQTRLP
jgi:hypothetical protein